MWFKVVFVAFVVPVCVYVCVGGEQAKFQNHVNKLSHCSVVLIHAFVQPAPISEVLLFATHSGRYPESYRNVNT